jgi:opacity protein-like surface antigen
MTKLRSVVLAAAAIAVFTLGGAAPAQAQITRVESGKNAIGFNVGGFFPQGFDSRVDDDVLVNDLTDDRYSLLFDIEEFKGVTFGAEYVAGIGDYLEAGFGVSFYQKTVPSIYEFKISENGSEIAQDLKLRIVPLSATVRFLPIGRRGVTPYVGGGIAAFNWHYSEAGDFVFAGADGDITDTDRFVADGWAAGPVILGGVRFPVNDAWTIGGEVRYQSAEGKGLLEQSEFFTGDKIDLGGWTANFTTHIRF